MPIDCFPDPFGSCSFLDEERVFVVIFHNASLTHYHFVYSTKTGQMESKSVKIELGGHKKNFPYDSFYNPDRKEIYVFYRTGQALTIKQGNLEEYKI